MSEAKNLNLEARVAALEAEMVHLRRTAVVEVASSDVWREDVIGAFEGSKGFWEAVRLGREYRESLRPKPRRKRAAK